MKLNHAQARAKVGGFLIKSKRDAERFLDIFAEFEIYSWNTECEISYIWFRNSDSIEIYTINHEESGVVGVSRDGAISYLFRMRKYINYWIRENDTEYWYTSKAVV